jgi:crotonobetainyl-CoA:carnitine CoA-transferase CaiB-like acyl-CoA transferase
VATAIKRVLAYYGVLPAPLEDLIILDLTRLLPGAAATAEFVERGATVIKIEQPGEGDYARSLVPEVFRVTNAGKKSVAIDLKNPRGRQLFMRLAGHADVLIEGFRPGVMDRLGLGFEHLHMCCPQLIYASLTGYGQTGRYSSLAGHDINYLALGGVLELNLPVIPGVQIADLAGGALHTVNRVLFALLERAKTGKGSYVDISMLAGVEALLTIPLALYRTTGLEPRAGGETLSGRYACYNIYECADGRWVAVGALEPKFWRELCVRLGCEDLIPDQFAEGDRQAIVKDRLAATFRTRTAQQWFEMLAPFDCCVTPVRTVSEVARELDPLPASRRGPAPGEHTREIFNQYGIDDHEFETLRQEGVIATWPGNTGQS